MPKMSNWNTIKAIRRKSEIARIRAKRRWELDRQRRASLAAKDPAFTDLAIIRRIIVIDHESSVKEAVIYSTDSRRAAANKIRRALNPRA